MLTDDFKAFDDHKGKVGPLKKAISKRRIRNRFGPDPSYMGFTKSFLINKKTGRAN